MISSALYPKLDPDNIAAFSSTIITKLMRDQMGFTRLVMSRRPRRGQGGQLGARRRAGRALHPGPGATWCSPSGWATPPPCPRRSSPPPSPRPRSPHGSPTPQVTCCAARSPSACCTAADPQRGVWWAWQRCRPGDSRTSATRERRPVYYTRPSGACQRRGGCSGCSATAAVVTEIDTGCVDAKSGRAVSHLVDGDHVGPSVG
jgi:hypothetical protein